MIREKLTFLYNKDPFPPQSYANALLIGEIGDRNNDQTKNALIIPKKKHNERK